MNFDDYLEQVEANAAADWKLEATKIFRRLASGSESFTADDVWAELEKIGVATHEPRAMGPIAQLALREKWVTHDGYSKSKRRSCHNRPITVYKPNL